MERGLFFLVVLLGFAVLSGPARADKPGERRYNFTSRKMEFYDGSNWYNFNLGLPLGGCAKEGEMEFSAALSLYQYCDGTNWIRLVGSVTLTGCSKKGEMDYMSNSYFYCNGLVWVNMKGALVI